MRYRRIPGLRAHTRGPWFHPKIVGVGTMCPEALTDTQAQLKAETTSDATRVPS